VAPSLRHILDLGYIITALLRNDSIRAIAERETERLGIPVSRNTIIGVSRDIRNGRLRPPSFDPLTYSFGRERDNGGIPVFDGQVTIEGSVIIINDVHLPFTNYDLAQRVVDVAGYYDITTMVIAGDLLDMDSQSTFKRKVRSVPLAQEIDAARELLAYYAQHFTRIWVMPGNHEERLLKHLDGELTFDLFTDLIRPPDPELVDVFMFTPYDQITIDSGGHEYMVVHQRNSSAISLKIGESLAWKYQKNMIVTHQHNSAKGYDKYGRYLIIDSGGLHNQKRTPYMGLKTSTGPVHDEGFVTVVNGWAELWVPDERYTQWSRLYGAA